MLATKSCPRVTVHALHLHSDCQLSLHAIQPDESQSITIRRQLRVQLPRIPLSLLSHHIIHVDVHHGGHSIC